jgi:glycine cleavage system aminomethyltransferase T
MVVGQVYYTPWCDERGRVIDDGTVSRLGEQRIGPPRHTSAVRKREAGRQRTPFSTKSRSPCSTT